MKNFDSSRVFLEEETALTVELKSSGLRSKLWND